MEFHALYVNTKRIYILEKQKVLILDGDSRQCLPFVRSLRKKGYHITIICPWKCCPGYFSRYPNKKLIWPDINHYQDDFYKTLISYLREEKADIVLALGDATAILVSKNRDEITKYTKTPVPCYDILKYGADKSLTMDFCMKNNIPCPKTFDPEDISIDEIVNKLEFPVMVKPVRGIGAVGLHRFEKPEALLNNFEKLTSKYGKLQIQEYIPQTDIQFQAEAFCDESSIMKVCMVIAKPRFFPITGGTSTCNYTIDRPDIVKNVRKLLEGVKWVGSADVDLILDPRDNVAKILEINPRVTAGIKIGFDAGIDYADLQMRLAFGRQIPEINKYRLGIVLRNICLDLLWYKYSSKEDRRKTAPPFWRFFGKNIKYQTFRIDDPLPLVAFVISNLKKYLKPGVWKSKLGTDL